MSDIQVSLPSNIVIVPMPEFQANSVSVTIAGSTRITELINTRVTRGSHTRVTRDSTLTQRPEVLVLALPSNILPVILPTLRGKHG